MAPFPHRADYVEALQDPASCFSDPELAAGAVQLDALGLPRAVSGNFASVFRVESPQGRTLAVRCFVRPVEGLEQRYAAVARLLPNLPGTWRVGFDLQRRGVRIGDDWFPVVKMHWVEGEPLLKYVRTHLWDRAAMSYLAVRFAQLLAQLRRAGVAHGDLQHGNVIVAPGGDLRLVDYDGMYVPELAGLPNTELGHRNYQQPQRTRADFGPHLDNFAGWVIYASLVALAVDPLLWGRLDAGDECLLFRARDFAEPDVSPAFAHLEQSDDGRLRRLAAVLRHSVAAPPAAVPPVTFPLVVPPPAAASRQAQDELSERRRLFEALEGGAGTRTEETAPPQEAGGRPPGVGLVSLEPALRRARLLLAAFAGTVCASLAATVATPLPAELAALVGMGGAAAWAFDSRRGFAALPAVAERRRVEAELAEHERLVEAARARVEELLAARRAATATAGIGEDGRSRWQAALREVEEELQARLAELAAEEQEVVRAAGRRRADALAQMRREALDQELRAYPLASANLTGIGEQLAYALALDGVRTAADLVDVDVPAGRQKGSPAVELVLSGERRVRRSGLGPEQARTLVAWRRALERRVEERLPTALLPEVEAVLAADVAGARARIDQEVAAARAGARRRAEEIAKRVRSEEERQESGTQEAQREAAARRLAVDVALVAARKHLVELEFHLETARRRAAAHAQVSMGAFLRALPFR